MSYQVFKGDVEENKFIKAFKEIIAETKLDLREFSNTAYQSVVLGEALYDLKLIPVYNILQKDLMLKAWSKIVGQFPVVGTINAYCELIYAIFGEQAYIQVDNEVPLNLKLNVVANYQSLQFWTTKQTGELIVTHSGENIEFKAPLFSVSNRELFNLIYEMTNAGTNIDIQFKLTANWTQPNLTQNGTPGVDDMAVFSVPANADLWQAFDGDTSTSVTFSTQNPIVYTYSKDYIRITDIAINGGYITNWQVSGSVDNQKYDLLKTGTNANMDECGITLPDNVNYYKYYKLELTGTGLKINDVKITALGGSKDTEFSENDTDNRA